MFKELTLAKPLKNFDLSIKMEFYKRDFEKIPAGLTPGEWCLMNWGEGQVLGFANPFAEVGALFWGIEDFPSSSVVKDIDTFIVKRLEWLIQKSLKKRKSFLNLDQGSRLVYGFNDYLPGLIVDEYVEHIIVQVNTAGLDKYREEIKRILESETKKQVTFLDNPNYRKNEGLPVFDIDRKFEVLEIEENGFKYNLDKSIIQKVGYYYDHRENRKKLEDYLLKWSGAKETGCDLFSYVGSWGLHALRGGIKNIEFVDQANMNDTTLNNLKLNGFEGRGKFTRQDVFKWLEGKKGENVKYDLVISDPPAFSKNLKSKNKAILGYTKLHSLAMSLVKPGGLLAVASCTHGVSHEELDRTVIEARKRLGRQVSLLDIGIQGPDHTLRHLGSSGAYIKYLLYLVE